MPDIEPEGGCLCNSIRYRIKGTPLAQGRCHCRSCRRASGAPSVAWVVVNASDFAFIDSDPVRFRSSPSVTRTFCGKCGTPLTYQHDERAEEIDVTTASLDDPEAYPPTKPVFPEQKLSWA